MQSSSLEQKQAFLRKEILEEGFDGNQFMIFLNKSNPKKGDDLDQYTLEQLSAIVYAFKPNNKGSDNDSPLKKGSQPFVSSPLKKTNSIDDSTYFEQIQCQSKLMNTLYKKHHELDIIISRWQKVQGGFLEKSYVKYTVLVPKIDTRVHRRYSEFQWLRNLLKLMYPGLPIPPLPKKGKMIRVEEKYLNKRMYLLQKFLNQLSKIPQIASDKLFQHFISTPGGKEFQKVKQLYSKVDLVPLRKIKTINGTINIGTEKELSTKVSKCFQYMRESQPEMKKIYKNFKGVATNFQQAADFFKGITSNCQLLQKKEQSIRSQLNLSPISGQSSLLLLGTFTQDFANSLTEFAKTFRKDIYSLAKYESFYKINIIQSIQNLNAMQQEYLQAKINLSKKKQKLYAEGKVSKWGLKKQIPKPASKEEALEIMLPKQTSEMMTLRENYALFNVQIFQECLRHTRNFNANFIGPLYAFLDKQERMSSKNAQNISKVAAKAKEVSTHHDQT